MTPKFNNAKRFFVTARQPISAVDLLASELKAQCDPKTVIDAGGVWLDRTRVTDPNLLLETGQTLRIYVSKFQSKHYHLHANQIVYEDEQLLIINKPSGVTAVADRSDQFYNVTAAVHAYLKKQNIHINYAPINRLDFMVSGLMIYAKTAKSVRLLSQAIQTRKIHKLYEATLTPKDGLPTRLRIKTKLDFAGKAFESPNGRLADSLFQYKGDRDGNPLYSVIIFTGRRHQIRAHAALYLSPILGDDLYGKPNQDPPLSLRAIGLNFWLLGKRYRIRL